MIPSVGQHVKCLIKNNTIAEGIVEEWNDSYVKLKALDGQSYLIIHHPGEDIMLTKVMLSENSEEIPEESKPKHHKPKPTGPQPTLEQAFQKLTSDEGEDMVIDEATLNAKSMAELQLELAQQERAIVAAKLRDHHVGEVRKVKYGYPGLYKKPSAQ